MKTQGQLRHAIHSGPRKRTSGIKEPDVSKRDWSDEEENKSLLDSSVWDDFAKKLDEIKPKQEPT